MSSVAPWLQLAGLCLELRGVFSLANAYLPVPTAGQGLKVLAGALLGRRSAEAVVRALGNGLAREDPLLSLRGLAWLGVGFALQALGVLLAVLG